MLLRDALAADIAGPAKEVFVALVCLCRGDATCTATIGEIASATGISGRHVKRLVAELERAGSLQIERGTGRGKGSNYRPTTDLVKAKRVTCMHTNDSENTNEIIERVTEVPLKGVVTNADVTLSSEITKRRDLDKRARVVVRRRAVRDGFLSFIAMLEPNQFVTVSGLAHELGMSPGTVRSDLQAVFRTLDICVPDQLRLKKSQRRAWHAGKLGKPTRHHAERG